jgi:hypothetical protein
MMGTALPLTFIMTAERSGCLTVERIRVRYSNSAVRDSVSCAIFDSHPELGLYLEAFLEDRNRFVHRLFEIPNFSLSLLEPQGTRP